MDVLNCYRNAADAFLETMRLKHSYGEQLDIMVGLEPQHIPSPESITFVLDWDKEDRFLKDLQDLFKKLVRTYSSRIKVNVIFQGNSIIAHCLVPAHLQSILVKLLLENKRILNEEGVILIKAGHVTVFTRTTNQS